MTDRILKMKLAGMSFRAIGRALSIPHQRAWEALQDSEERRELRRKYDARYYRRKCGLPT